MKPYLHAFALFVAIFPAFAAGASTSGAPFKKKSIEKSFHPVVLVRHDLGDHAGRLYCPANACVEIQHSEANQGRPRHLTAYTVQPGKKSPSITLECNGAGSLYCEVIEQRSPSGDGSSLVLVAENVFVPGDGCLYTANSGHVDHPVRRKFCQENGQFREQPQPVQTKKNASRAGVWE